MLKPFDVVMSVLDSLTDKEKAQLRDALEMKEHPCGKAGHKYQPYAHVPPGWFSPAQTKLYCPKCGMTTVVSH